jgi:hypothetical protein
MLKIRDKARQPMNILQYMMLINAVIPELNIVNETENYIDDIANILGYIRDNLVISGSNHYATFFRGKKMWLEKEVYGDELHVR